jgi:hypothetical protein
MYKKEKTNKENNTKQELMEGSLAIVTTRIAL